MKSEYRAGTDKNAHQLNEFIHTLIEDREITAYFIDTVTPIPKRSPDKVNLRTLKSLVPTRYVLLEHCTDSTNNSKDNSTEPV